MTNVAATAQTERVSDERPSSADAATGAHDCPRAAPTWPGVREGRRSRPPCAPRRRSAHGAARISPPPGDRARPPSFHRGPTSSLCGTHDKPPIGRVSRRHVSLIGEPRPEARAAPSGVEKHRPPTRSRASRRATECPASWSLDAAVRPDTPPPTTMASKRAGDGAAMAVHDTTATRRAADRVDERAIVR